MTQGKMMQTKLREAIVGLTVTVVGCLLLFAGSLCAFGQETRASLGGRVTDPQGHVLTKANVVVTAIATGVVQTTETNEAGNWKIQYLLPGFYQLEVSAPAFKPSKYSGLELQVSDQKTIDTQLQVGTDAQTITVEATTPLIDTTAAVSGTVITTNEMMELPSMSNAPTMLIGLTPGATTSTGNSGGVYLWSNIGLSSTAVNGTGAVSGVSATTYSAVGYKMDGGSDSNNTGQMAFSPPLDAVGEFKVVTNAFDASIGRSTGASITLSSKTGGKAFHGDAYEYNQNNFLNANSYANNAQTPVTPKAPIHTNNYGGTFGGPVWIPKIYDGKKRGTFFFLSYSGIRNKAPVNPGYATVPTAAERNGDFSSSYIWNAGTKFPIDIYDPNSVVSTGGGNFARSQFGTGCTNANPRPSTCNVIPSIRLDPVAKAVMALLPSSNTTAQTSVSNTSNNYLTHEAQDDKFETYMVRVDHAWNNNNHTYVNLRQNHWKELSLDPFGPTFYLNGFLQTRLNKGVTIDHTVTINQNMLLDLNYNVIRYVPTTKSASAGIDPTVLSPAFSSTYISQMQQAAIPLYGTIVPGAEKNGLGTNEAGNTTADTIQDFNGSITHAFRNHSMHYGAEYMIQQQASGALGTSGGTFTFGYVGTGNGTSTANVNNWTNSSPVGATAYGSGSAVASFMLGLPTAGSIPTSTNGFWSQHYTAFYFQDDWRVTPKLTLDLGLRWDYERPVSERFDRYAYRFDPDFVATGSVNTTAQANYTALVGGAAGTNTGLALLQAQRPNASGFVAKGGLLYAGLNGTSRYVTNPLKKYLQPRLGFAYQIRENTVVRGGVGRFVQADFNNGTGGAGGQIGYSQTSPVVIANNFQTAPNFTLENPVPGGLQPLTGNTLGEMTNFGNVTTYTDPNIGRVYVDQASASIQQQVKSFLIEVGVTLDETHGLNMSWEVNDPSAAAWYAANNPQFTSTGAPVITSAGATTVTNPFYHVAGVATSATAYTSATVAASNLLRPNPVLGNLLNVRGTGQSTYYALNTKVERRFRDGFSILQSFSWSKKQAASSFIGPQTMRPVIYHQLATDDTKFHYVLTPMYELPFGHGKRHLNKVNRLTDELIGGWEFNGIYQFQSGTPLTLPTNTNAGQGSSVYSGFFQGGNPSLGSKKTGAQWFDTSKFAPIPTSSTCASTSVAITGCSTATLTIANYPTWTGVQGMPGSSWVPTPGVSGYSKIANGVYNDFATRVTYNQQVWGSIRNPYVNTFTIGMRKSFDIAKGVHFQLGADLFNALNHPQFGNIDVNPADAGFGAISGSASTAKWVPVNSPRTVQLRGRLTF